MRRFHRPASVLAGGLVLTILMAEILIRLAGTFMMKGPPDSALEPPRENSFRIIFLGNSHTFGASIDPRFAYSHVLDGFFRTEAPGTSVQIYKEGIISGTTRDLNERMDILLPQIRPHLVVVMGGEPNVWSPYGFSDYLLKVKGSEDLKQKGMWLRELLSHSRFIRWLYSLNDLPTRSALSSVEQNDLAAYEILASWEAHPRRELLREEGLRMRSVLTTFMDRHRSLPSPVKKRFLYVLGTIEITNLKNYDHGLKLLEESMRTGPTGYHVPASDILFETLNGEKFPSQFSQRLQWLKESAAMGKGELDGPSLYDPIGKNLDISLLERAVKKYPEKTRLTKALAMAYLDKKEHMKVLKLYADHLEVNPLQILFGSIYEFIDEASKDPRNKEAKEFALEVKNRFIRKFPSESGRFERRSNNDLENWISWDLGNLVKKIRRNDAEVVIQNYHSVKGYKEGENVQTAIARAADEQRAHFIDTHAVYSREVRAYPEDPQKFFADNVNHPTESGHRIIARIIYDYLNKKKLLPAELLNLRSKLLYKYSWE